MDKLCNNLELEDLNKTVTNVEDSENVRETSRCESPVFKCLNLSKTIRRVHSNSSDYDIPSYQINQSAKSRTSSKCGNETSDSVLPFSPILSPIPVPSSLQFQPPSIHSLGTVAKNFEKLCKNKFEANPVEIQIKPGGVFETLGMTDKDISWVSSMASPPPHNMPKSEFNTIERATFLPEDKFQNIQPRALFSPTHDDDFGCQLISFSSDSEDDAYKSNIRLSDVCATLNKLEVKSLEQISETGDNSSENNDSQKKDESSLLLQMISKKPEDNKKKKKECLLVSSPTSEDKYEFSVGESMLEKKRPAGNSQNTNFLEDDSFQSMSFSGIDELCKTLVNVTEQTESSILSRSVDPDKTLVNDSVISSSKPKEKNYYVSKSATEVFLVTSLDNLHSYAAALEEGDVMISGSNNINKSYTEKGIVRFDMLEIESSKVEGIKRLHSELSEENDGCHDKKFKKAEEATSDWDTMKKYLSESQLNVSEGEIFRTVENLEKTLASQESKDLEKENLGETGNTALEMRNFTSSSAINDHSNTSTSYFSFERGPSFTTASGSKISVSEKALTKVRDILKDFEEPLGDGGFRVGRFPASCAKIQVSKGALERAKALMSEFSDWLPGGFSTGSGKRMPVSADALKKGKALVVDCGKDSTKNLMRGFSTGSGKEIQVPMEALEKAKALMATCDLNLKETSDELTSVWMEELAHENVGGQRGKPLLPTPSEKRSSEKSLLGGHAITFSTASNKKVTVSAAALEKARSVLSTVDHVCENVNINFPPDVPEAFPSFSTASGLKVAISEGALAKAKECAARWEHNQPDDYGNIADCTNSFKTRLKTMEESKSYDGGKQNRLSTTSGIEGFNVKEADDWDEIIPNWLHVYNTSPSIASDRIDVSPRVSHEDGKSSKPEREYIVTSPVLGSRDRFYKKVKRRKLRFEENPDSKPEAKSGGFRAPYKDGEKKPSLKRNSTLDVDFSAPFKKTKFLDAARTDEVGLGVKERRRQAKEAQKKTIKEKQSVKPVKGLHLRRKCSEKQVKWIDAVEGTSPEVHPQEILKVLDVKDSVLSIRIENAANFKFTRDFFGSTCLSTTEGIPVGDGCMLIPDEKNEVGVEEFKRGFLACPGVQPNLVPVGWVENHYKWIVWKLSHYERSFPRHFGGRCLTPNNVSLQLKYRYDREIDRSERPAIRKILEGDDSAAKRMVLCVCAIKKMTNGEATGYELGLTDGWYSCPARCDPAMTRFIESGKVFIGTKLMIHGASLINCDEGISPLEMREDIYLKISTNSTRRIRWDSKLGFQRHQENFPVSLNSILPQGGGISRLDVILVRIYPMLYMEKTPDGHHVTRNRRSEEKAEAEYRKIQEERMEIIRNEVQAEMRKSVLTKANSGKRLNKTNLGDIEQVEDLCQLVESSSDPSALQELMSADQRQRLQNFQLNQSDRFNREMAEKIENKLKKEKLNRRNVSEFMRAKVVDFRKPDYNNPAILSVWNPHEEVVALLSEGKVISLTNVSVSNSTRTYKTLQINTTRQTQFRILPRSVKYPGRKLTRLKEVSSKACPAFEEVDLVGLVTKTRDVSYGSRMSQIVYLTDLEFNFVSIVFWGSCKDYGWENVLKPRSVVACSNLQWKKNSSVQEIPSLHVNENSAFTENPRQSHLKEEVERLKGSMPEDLNAFLTKCEEDLTGKLEESRWQANTSRNSSMGETGARAANYFESGPTASSTPIKPFSTCAPSDETEPSPIQKRIEKLQSYGEPPSLIPLIIRNGVRRKMKKK